MNWIDETIGGAAVLTLLAVSLAPNVRFWWHRRRLARETDAQR